MLLHIENLKTHYKTRTGVVKAVDGVSIKVDEGEVFGIAGESGCGKSTLIRTIMRLTPSSARISADRMELQGVDLLGMSDKQYSRDVLWKKISMVPQSAMNSLNPVYRVGDQITEAILFHTDVGRNEAMNRAKRLFNAVGLEESLVTNYPHEFSGGMRQRALIAMSLALNPAMIIMDEPTTGLDVLVQERILRSLAELREQMEKPQAIILITHDISVIAEMADRIGIMYAGKMMEQGSAMEMFHEPFHPYTLGLKNAFPSIKTLGRELISIPGSPPNLEGDNPGCLFEARCPFAIPQCKLESPPPVEVSAGHVVHCIRTDSVEEFRSLAQEKHTWHCSKLKT